MFKLNPICAVARHSLPVLALLWAAGAFACNVPVFRYALERWEADRFEAIVFCQEPLPPEQQAGLNKLDQAITGGRVNLTVTRADPAAELPSDLRTLWMTQGNPQLPWMVLRYPRPSGIHSPAWSGPLRQPQIEPLLESPVRQTIAQKLLAGDSVVWLLLESGDPQRDTDTAKRVESELRKLEQTLKLPEPSPFDPPVNPALPLKLAFSIVRVSRTDPAERALVSLLLNWNPLRTPPREPMLFPIFGRGRAMPPAVGDEIQPGAIRDMAVFLTGPCSCEIKDMNPGFDLLLTADWNTMSGYQEVALPTPPLVGMSQFVSAATNPSTPTTATVAATKPSLDPPAMPTVADAPIVPAQSGLLGRNLAVLLGLGLAFLAITTIVLRARSGGRSL